MRTSYSTLMSLTLLALALYFFKKKCYLILSLLKCKLRIVTVKVINVYDNWSYPHSWAVVKAYQYTSITSVMLLDCWSIPCVMVLTWFFLSTKYRFKKIAGVAVCVAGLVMVVFSDVHAGDQSGKHRCFIHFTIILSCLLHSFFFSVWLLFVP